MFIILITFKVPLCERCLVNNLELLSSKYCTTQHLLSKIMMAFREKKTAEGNNNPFVWKTLGANTIFLVFLSLRRELINDFKFI